VVGVGTAIFIRAKASPPLVYVIPAVETEILGILIGVGALVLVALIGVILNGLFDNVGCLIVLGILSLIFPIIGSIVGAWYGVYGWLRPF
jgi:hypothetical protein